MLLKATVGVSLVLVRRAFRSEVPADDATMDDVKRDGGLEAADMLVLRLLPLCMDDVERMEGALVEGGGLIESDETERLRAGCLRLEPNTVLSAKLEDVAPPSPSIG